MTLYTINRIRQTPNCSSDDRSQGQLFADVASIVSFLFLFVMVFSEVHRTATLLCLVANAPIERHLKAMTKYKSLECYPFCETTAALRTYFSYFHGYCEPVSGAFSKPMEGRWASLYSAAVGPWNIPGSSFAIVPV